MPRQSSGRAERWRAPRFPLAVPVETPRGVGTTRNISTSGVFFEIGSPFGLGEPIRLALVLEHAHPNAPLRLQGTGRVVRVKKRSGTFGVGVAVTWDMVEPLEARALSPAHPPADPVEPPPRGQTRPSSRAKRVRANRPST